MEDKQPYNVGQETMNDPEQIKKLVKERVAAEKAAHKKQPAEPDKEKQVSAYLKDGFLCRSKSTRDGDIPIRLCNFSAQITAENLHDNGVEVAVFYEIEGKLRGKIPLPVVEVKAESFAGMTWVNRWGARCCLEAGMTVRDSARHAIQSGSKDIKTTTFYSHTGWRSIDGKLMYLHAGGAIGSDGGVAIKLPPELQRYTFLPPPQTKTEQENQLSEAIKASLDFLDVGRRSVTLPLFAFCFLAPLTTQLTPMPGFSFFLHGASGCFKTSLATLALNFFGSFPGNENLSNFDDSDGALEMRAFTLKDELFCIDDWHPSSNRAAALLRESRLQRIIRSFGNRTSRGRLNADLTSKNRYPPRGLLICTGEEQAQLESSIARLCTCELTAGAISKTKLTEMQEKAGLLNVAMRSYIEWLAAHMPEIQADFPARFKELRTAANGDGLHGRLPEQAAYLQFSIETAVAWLVDSRAVSNTGADDLLNESWITFQNLAAAQQKRIADDDPVANFIEIIGTLIIQQNIRILPTEEGAGVQIGAGEVVGHYDDEFIYLDPVGAWHSVQRFCIMEGTHFPFTKNTFYQMLKNRGVIQASATGECTLIRKIGGKSCRVLKVISPLLYSKVVANVAD